MFEDCMKILREKSENSNLNVDLAVTSRVYSINSSLRNLSFWDFNEKRKIKKRVNEMLNLLVAQLIEEIFIIRKGKSENKNIDINLAIKVRYGGILNLIKNYDINLTKENELKLEEINNML